MTHRKPSHVAPASLRLAMASAAAVLATVCPCTARADVTSWLAFGGGYAGEVKHKATSFDSASAFSYSIGVGSSPLQSFVVGGIFRGTTMFGLGTDIGPAIRAATGGF